MKAAWEAKAVGDVCSIVGGGTPSRSNAAFYGGEIPWATIRDMKADWIKTTEFSITPIAVKSSATNVLPAGTVIVASRVGLGKICRLRQDTAINQDLRGFIPKSAKQLDPQYLFLWFKSVADQIVAAGTGATVQGVTLPFLRSLEIPLPPLEEQRRIVAVLDEAFAAIATATANAEKNLADARKLFSARAENVFSQRGEGWRDLPLGEICDFLNGFAFKSSDAVENSRTQLVRMGNLHGWNLDLERKAAFYPDHFASDYERFVLSEGDIIISLTGTTGKEDYGFAVMVPHSDRALLMNQRIAKFDRVNESLVNRDYLLLFLRSRSFLDVLYSTANGTRQANLSTVTMKKIPVPLCPIPMQEAIVSSLNVLADETTRLATLYRKKLDAMDELGNALLQQAFTGDLTAMLPETIAA